MADPKILADDISDEELISESKKVLKEAKRVFFMS